MLTRLHVAGLIADAATQDQVNVLYNDWQMPMYRIDFRRIEVPLEELQAARDATLWAEMGDNYG